MPKYSLPKVLPQQQLPGEAPTTFFDVILQEVIAGDDVLAAFKFTRFNNFKPALYNSLGEYESPKALSARFGYNKVVQSLFNQQAPEGSYEGADPRFVAAVNLAVALLPLEKGDILSTQPQFQALIDTMSKPVCNTVEEALLLGSLIMPAVEACMRIYKTKLPKK